MNEKLRSQKGFVAVTLITVLAIALVLVVYATLLGTFQGQSVNVVSLNGTIKYCKTNSATASDWTVTLSDVANGSSWYALFNTTSGGYAGSVSITWWLQKNSGTWQNMTTPVKQTTSATLTGNVQVIYAADVWDNQAGNKNWGASTTAAGEYRIMMKVVTA